MLLNKKSVLVTGADGFIGSHLVERLVDSGAKVRALSYYNSFNHWGWLESLQCLGDVEVMSGDVRDPHFCMKITENVDIIFHLAALIAIPYSYTAPASYVDTNINGTLNICQAAVENSCERVIHTSTSEVYGTAQYVPIDESHPLQPQSPYSASKIGADHLALSFYLSFGLPVTIARPFNTFGPRQSARAVIPAAISQITAGKKIIQMGDLSPTRDFTYVRDTCQGLIALAASDRTVGEAYNIGSGIELSIAQILDLVKELMGSNAEVVTEKQRIRPKQSEVQRLCCDHTKIRKATGFKPEYTFRDGLVKTIAWFTSPGVLSQYKTDIYNV